MQFSDQLTLEMESSGLYINGSIDLFDVIKFQRFKEADRATSSKNIFVRLFDQERGAVFGNWKHPETWRTWWVRNPKKLSYPERQARKKELRELEKERQLLLSHARYRATLIWSDGRLSQDCFEHGYIKAKKIIPYYARQFRSYLILPIRDFSQNIISLQFIRPNGRKRFKYQSSPKEGFLLLGEVIGLSDCIRICEGYATGCSIYEAVGSPVIIGFNANNLVGVAKGIRLAYPQNEIHVCCDNDAVGLAKGMEAASAVGGLLKVPSVNDWNDLFVLEGVEEVERQLLT